VGLPALAKGIDPGGRLPLALVAGRPGDSVDETFDTELVTPVSEFVSVFTSIEPLRVNLQRILTRVLH
jgi:hypothetical protein